MNVDGNKEKILNAAEKRMLRFGYRKVAMDEIASDLAMSKNTIYKYFQSKEEIASMLFERLRNRINENQIKIEKTFKNPLDIIKNNIVFLQKELSPWFENFLPDIKQELPQLWANFVSYRKEKILEVEELIKEGIKNGQFRKVNSFIAVKMFLGAVNEIINPEVLQHESISFQEALEGLLDIWANGILRNRKDI